MTTLILHITKACRMVLKDGEIVTIGRAAYNKLSFTDLCLSRVHARINWSNNQPFIQDCGSTGGTFVDGKLVTKKFLTKKHRIQLGETRLVAEVIRSVLPSSADTPTLRQKHEGTKKDIENLGDEKNAILDSITNSDSIVLYSEKHHHDDEGLLKTNSEFCKHLIKMENGKRTGTLYITDEPTKRKASITLAYGRILDAKMGVILDQEALLKILDFTQVTYDFVRKINVGVRKMEPTSATMFINRVAKKSF